MQFFHKLEDSQSGIEEGISVLTTEYAFHFSTKPIEGSPVLEVWRVYGMQFFSDCGCRLEDGSLGDKS